MQKYAINSSFKALSGKSEELVAAYLELAAVMEKEASCHLFVVSKHMTELDKVWITEIWDSEKEMRQTKESNAAQEVIVKAKPLLEDVSERGLEMEVIGGYGISS